MNRKQRAHSPQLAAGLASESKLAKSPREVEDSLQIAAGNFNRDTCLRLARFIAVGLSNTLISFLSFQLSLLLLTGWVLRAAASQIIGYSAGVIWSYYWNRRWSFRSSGRPASELPRFLGTQLLCLLLSTAAMGLACDYARLPATAAWVAIMAGVTLLNFCLLQAWVFRPEKSAVRGQGRYGRNHEG